MLFLICVNFTSYFMRTNPDGDSQPQISTFLTQLVTIYQQAQVLPELSTALIATSPKSSLPTLATTPPMNG
jgi:hypothetical protein